MTREEFMDIVYSELHSDGDNYRANRIIDAADEYAEAQIRWIPVSERLPEYDHIVIISIHEDRIDYVSTGFYDSGFEMWLDPYDEMVNVVAWMPLPDVFMKEGA